MVKKNGESKKNGGSKIALPEGFRSVVAERAAGFYRPTSGVPVQGVLLSRQSKKAKDGKAKWYYQIRLTEPCVGILKKEDGEIELEAGQILNVDESKALEVLSEHVNQGKAVFLAPEEKVPLENGQSFWRYQVGIAEHPL